MSPSDRIVIEVFGEGKTDVGEDESRPHRPEIGVVPILLHTLCGSPSRMFVKRYGRRFMQSKGSLKQKVRFAKRQAKYNAGTVAAVFAVDSDGDLRKTATDLTKGRAMESGDFPMAIGIAHPCIESWLLADAEAIKRGLDLPGDPEVPEEPEKLPAPRRDRSTNPKTVLKQAAGSRKELSTVEKDKIAAAMRDMARVEQRCPLGFGPFADEVRQYIGPLFG